MESDLSESVGSCDSRTGSDGEHADCKNRFRIFSGEKEVLVLCLEITVLDLEKLFSSLEKSSLTLEKFPFRVEKFLLRVENFPLTLVKSSFQVEKFALPVEKFPSRLEKLSLSLEKFGLILEKFPLSVEKFVVRLETPLSAFLQGARPMPDVFQPAFVAVPDGQVESNPFGKSRRGQLARLFKQTVATPLQNGEHLPSGFLVKHPRNEVVRTRVSGFAS